MRQALSFRLTGERGNALVLAVLILLALTSVGLVSLQRTGSDLLVAGNVVHSSRARQAGEAGIIHGIADTRSRLVEILRELNSPTNPDAAKKIKQGLQARSSALPATDDNHVAAVLPGDASLAAMARKLQAITYAVDLRGALGPSLTEWKNIPGYEVGDMCFKIFEFDAKGGIPTADGETVDQTVDERDTTVVRYRARVVLGPWKCDLM